MANRTNFQAANAFAEYGLKEKALGRRESASGPGSYLDATQEALTFLRDVISDHNISSVLDLGCGDWNWMQHMGFPNVGGRTVRYTGWDAHEPLVASLNEKYGCEGVQFQFRDIVTENYPDVDLIIARDVLFHIPTDMTLQILEKVRDKATYFVSTSYPEVKANVEPVPYLVEGWGFAKINLNAPPYNLGKFMISSIEETKCKAGSGHKRYLCLYGPPAQPSEQ